MYVSRIPRNIIFLTLLQMIEGIFRLTFPLSYPILLLSITIVLCISILCIGTLSSVFFVFLVQSGILRLKPIADLLQGIVHYLWPDVTDRIIRNLRTSFPVDVRGTLPPQGIYLFHPHGLLSMAHMTNIGIKSVSNWPVKAIRGTNIYSLWYSFGISEMSEGAFVPANYSTMKKVIEEKLSLAVSLGGIDEMEHLYKGKIRAKIRTRKGVFRLAIETGTPLVPVLAYGENELCENYGQWKGFSWINEILRKFRATLILPSWALYEKFLAIHHKPFDVPVVSVIGEPVAVGPAREATEEHIELVKSIYIKRLREFYRQTRPAHYAEEIEIF